MSKKLLSGLDSDSSDGEETSELKVNQDYAHKYESWRRNEEMQKLKDKFGPHLDVIGESDLSGSDDGGKESLDDDSSEEQDINEEIFDEQFFKVYSALKSGNPEIYDKNVSFFKKQEETTEGEGKEKAGKSSSPAKKMSIMDYHRKLIEEKKGITEEDEEEMNNHVNRRGYYEELNDIRDEFKKALESDDDEEELVKNKPSTSNSKASKVSEIFEHSSQDEDISFLKNYWKKDNELDEKEKFLKDYIVNKRYAEVKVGSKYHSKDNFMPNEEFTSNLPDFDPLKEEEEKEDEIKINQFHFEEPDSSHIKRYPRNVHSLRDAGKKEQKSLKRSEAKEKKKKEKEEELSRLRKLKSDELKEKLKRLKDISGNERLDLNDLDLNVLIDDENDFDESKYDQKMQLLFGDNYYGDFNDGSKPAVGQLEGIDDDYQGDEQDYDEYDQTLGNEEEFANEEEEPSTSSKASKKNKKNKKEKKSKEVGIYEDLIGDLPTRFRYRMVEPNDFGLTDEEILFADEKELNKWCSLKKASQYRASHEEKYDQKCYQSKRGNIELKKKIFQSLYGDKPVEEGQNQVLNKSKKKKRRKVKKNVFNVTEKLTNKEEVNEEKEKVNGEKASNRKNNSNNEGGVEGDLKDTNSSQSQSSLKKKTRKRKKNNNNKPNHDKGVKSTQKSTSSNNISIDRLKAYGLSNNQIKRRKLV